MKPVLRYQSQLLFRKSYKPNRIIRIRPALLNAERQMKNAECGERQPERRIPGRSLFRTLHSQFIT